MLRLPVPITHLSSCRQRKPDLNPAVASPIEAKLIYNLESYFRGRHLQINERAMYMTRHLD